MIDTIASARRSGLTVSVGSGGDGSVVLDVSRLRGVGLGVGTVRAGAGTRLGDLYDALATHRLTVPAGGSTAAGLSGQVLGGGIGPLGRRYGLTCDRLLSAQVVLADGSVVTCSADQEPELFWMVRGGGAPPGVVTELVLATVRLPAATAFRLTYPVSPDLVEVWQQWAPEAPDDVTANLLLTATEATVSGVARDAAQLDGLTGQLPPAATEVSEGSYLDALRWLGAPAAGACAFFDSPLSRATITALIVEGGSLEFIPLGGAYNRVPAPATAFAHRADRVLLKASGVRESARPEESGRADLSRLRAVREAYDPDDVFTPPDPGTAG